MTELTESQRWQGASGRMNSGYSGAMVKGEGERFGINGKFRINLGAMGEYV
jgi:hypothetical protein